MPFRLNDSPGSGNHHGDPRVRRPALKDVVALLPGADRDQYDCSASFHMKMKQAGDFDTWHSADAESHDGHGKRRSHQWTHKIDPLATDDLGNEGRPEAARRVGSGAGKRSFDPHKDTEQN